MYNKNSILLFLMFNLGFQNFMLKVYKSILKLSSHINVFLFTMLCTMDTKIKLKSQKNFTICTYDNNYNLRDLGVIKLHDFVKNII